MDQQTINIMLACATGAIGGLTGIVGFFLRTKLQEYDDHLNYCSQKERLEGATDEKIATLQKEVDNARRSLHWIGNCMMMIGAKLDVMLPPRPQL